MKKPLRSSDNPRVGYSLVELLIVLAVLALMAGLTLPALRGPLEKSRLRGAGRQMQATLAKARSLAIRTGREHWLTYEIDGPAWRIEAKPEPIDAVDDVASVLGQPSAEAPATPEIVMVREGDLPAGVVFSDQGAITDIDEFAEPDVTLEPQTEKWSEPIRFKPNGRSEDATIRIAGTRDFVTEVRLRGLTGIAKSTTRREAVEDELALIEPDGASDAMELAR